jgi:hypothetical protein
MSIADLRREYHRLVCQDIIRVQHDKKEQKEYPNFADGSNVASTAIAWGIVNRLPYEINEIGLTGQTAGDRFEKLTKDFLEKTFRLLDHLRPGKWMYSTQVAIAKFDQYQHLAYLEDIIKKDIEKGGELASVLGSDYIITPDIVIGRLSVSDAEINQRGVLITDADQISTHTPLRDANQEAKQIMLHASISCKWTLRSDRGQNARTEALNLMRNRKGHLPHIVAITAEPLPTRIASLALGTGDLDCTYHFALYELQESLAEVGNVDQLDMLRTLITGNRLRDISDLPFDLAI